MTTMFSPMGNPFDRRPQLLGGVPMAGMSDVFRPDFHEGIRTYCDPSVDPLCEFPYEGPVLVTMAGDDTKAFQAVPSERESAPNLNCNVEWDPGCPRPKPSQTMVPYVPSSYLRGTEIGRRGEQLENGNPALNCNVAWDPGCPRPQPSKTLVPYVPQRYGQVDQNGIQYNGTQMGRTALRQKKQF